MTEVSYSTTPEQFSMHAELTRENVTSNQIQSPNSDEGSLRLGERNISGSRAPFDAGKQSSKAKQPPTGKCNDIDGIGSNQETAHGSSMRPSVHGLTPATSASRESPPATTILQGISLSRTKMKIWPLVMFSALEGVPNPSHGPDCVIEALKRAVDSHVTLQDHAESIDYKVCMVGLTPDESQPSIVVFCDKKHKYDLKSLFHSDFLFHINCRSVPRTHILVPWKGSSPTRPAFWLGYRFTKGPPTIRNAGSDGAIASLMMTSEMSCCGALLEYHQRYSTVGLMVGINGVARFITVEHVFDDQIHSEPSIAEIDEDSPWTDDSEDESEADVPTSGHNGGKDDISSDSSAKCTIAEGFSHPRRPDMPNSEKARSEGSKVVCSASATGTPALAYIKKESAHRVQETTQLPSHLPFLDWACVEVDSETMQEKLESCIVTGPETPPILLKEIAIEPASHATPVIMISGVRGNRPGTLLRDPTYIGAPRGQEMCKAWTMIMDSQLGIAPGECGSIVVNRDTYEVYGHIVGSNCLGHAYVVPLIDIISQMKTAFDTDNVQFPFQSTVQTSSKISTNEHRPRKGLDGQESVWSSSTWSRRGRTVSSSSASAYSSSLSSSYYSGIPQAPLGITSSARAAYAQNHPGVPYRPYDFGASARAAARLERYFSSPGHIPNADSNNQDVEIPGQYLPPRP